MNKQDKVWVLIVYWLMYVSIPPELSAYNECIKFMNLKSVVELMVETYGLLGWKLKGWVDSSFRVAGYLFCIFLLIHIVCVFGLKLNLVKYLKFKI